MDEAKRKRLAEAGYQATTVADFLGLSAEQSELIEIKLALTFALKQQRSKSSLSQSQLAEKIGSSQSRVAKMEAGDPHVSLDLMIRTLVAAGMTRGEIAQAMLPKPASALQSQAPSQKIVGKHYTFTTSPQRPRVGGTSGDKKVFGA